MRTFSKKCFFIISSIWPLLLGCSDKYHNIEYYAPFFYDSATVGAIRIEYDWSTRQGVTQPESSTSNVDQYIDFINIATQQRIKSILINKNMGSTLIPEGRFVAPWFLYHTGKDRHIEMMNIETQQRWKILNGFAHLNGISSKGNFALVDNTIYKREDGSIYRSFNSLDKPIYFDEDSMMLFAVINAGPKDYYINFHIIQNKTDTLILPPQGDALKSVDWNRYILYITPDSLQSGGITQKAFLVKTGSFLLGDFSSRIQGRHSYNSDEYFVEKDYYINGGILYRLTNFDSISTIFIGGQATK